MAKYDQILVYSDGGCKGNPGPGSIGVVVCDDKNRRLYSYSECIGECTNNQAEYHALAKGLDLAAKYTRRRVVAFSDSELLVRQMNGSYRLKNDKLRELYHDVRDRERVFQVVTYQHVSRGNQRLREADKLNRDAQAGRPTDKCHVQS